MAAVAYDPKVVVIGHADVLRGGPGPVEVVLYLSYEAQVARLAGRIDIAWNTNSPSRSDHWSQGAQAAGDADTDLEW